MWLDVASGEPLVTRRIAQREGAAVAASEFGETIVTRTSEGADQSEGRIENVENGTPSSHAVCGAWDAGPSASEFGETLQTESGEGHDQSERLA